MKKHLYLLFFSTVLMCLSAGKIAAQVKIGNNPGTLDPSSILELENTNKALYLTRVSLATTTDITTVPNPKAGMVVYNVYDAITGTALYPIAKGGTGVYYYNGAGWVAASCGNNCWKLTGNAGTVDGVNFLGTTDAVPLNFQVNGTKAGRIEFDNTTGNVSLGFQSQNNITTNGATGDGTFNTSVGNHTLGVNTTGRRNSALGYDALGANTTGDSNTAVGFGALQVNTTGFNNTATGAYSLNHNTIGKFNTADGYEALHTNISDSGLTAVGAYALYYNNGGKFNTTTGAGSMFVNTTGSGNTVNGSAALRFNYVGNNNAVFGANAGSQNNNPLLGAGVNGNNNTFIGTGADSANVTGNNNTTLGYQSGYLNNGSNNTYLGYKATGSAANLTNATAIGANANACVNNAMVLGAVDAGAATTNSVNMGINVCDPTQRIDFRNGHIRNRQDNLPIVSITVASGITAVAMGVNSSDVRGVINTTGTNNSATFTRVRVDFAYTATNAPFVTITPANRGASDATYYVTSDVNGFTLFYRAGVSAVFADNSFNYMVME